MFKYLLFSLAFINALSGMIIDQSGGDKNQYVTDVRQAFNALRQDPNNQDALNFLKEQLPNPKSHIWRELGKMIGLSDYDRLEECSKHLSLLSAKAFIESGGLDILYLWGGQNFAKEGLISVRDYLSNLSKKLKYEMIKDPNLKHVWNQFDPTKTDPNLDNPFLVENNALCSFIDKWIEEENGLYKNICSKPRAKTNAIGLLTRLLFHTDSDDRIGVVNSSQPVVERLFSSKFIANLLILLEESRVKGQLADFSPEKLWKLLTNNNAQGEDLLSGLHFDLDNSKQIKSITYRDFTSSGKGKNFQTTIKPNLDKYEQILWTQFFHLFFDSLKECGYFGEVKTPYPYFLPSLVLEGFVIRSEQQQGYNEVLKKYLDGKYPGTIPDKSNNPNNREIEYALFNAKNFFELKANVTKLAMGDEKLTDDYLNNAYVLHYLFTKGIAPQSQISTSYQTKSNKSTPSFTNCVETGLFNLFGVFLPFDQNTGGINLNAVKNHAVKESLKELGKNLKLKSFTQAFLVDQPWLPYLNLKFGNEVGHTLFGLKESVLYIKLPEKDYERVKAELEKVEGLIIESKNVGFECFKASYPATDQMQPDTNINSTDHPIGHDLVFIKENTDVMLYEVESGLMTFVLFERMIYQSNSIEDFLNIIKLPNKTKDIPEGFKSIMKDAYGLDFIINSDFSEAKKLWRGDCGAKAMKINKTEPLVVNLDISSGHTDVKFDVSDSIDVPMPKQSSSLPGFLQMAMYSSSQLVTVDNFECQHWLWLVQNVLFDEDAIINKEWIDSSYAITTVADLINKDPLLKLRIYKQRIISDPSWQLPDHLLSAKSLEFAARSNWQPLFKKIISSVTPQMLCKLLSTLDESEIPYIINIEKINCNSLKLIIEAFKGEHKLLNELLKKENKNKATLMHKISYKPESLKLIINTFKDKPEMLEGLLSIKDEYNNTPMFHAVRNPESLKDIIEVFKGEPKMLEGLLNIDDGSNQTSMHNAAGKADSLKLIIEAFKDKIKVIEGLLKIESSKKITPMHYVACNSGSLKLIFDMFKGDIELLKNLLTIKDKYNQTPMHNAVEKADSLKLIIQAFKGNADMLKELFTIENRHHSTPMHELVGYPDSLKSIINTFYDTFYDKPELLEELFTIKNVDGKTPLDFLKPEKRIEIEQKIHSIDNHPLDHHDH